MKKMLQKYTFLMEWVFKNNFIARHTEQKLNLKNMNAATNEKIRLFHVLFYAHKINDHSKTFLVITTVLTKFNFLWLNTLFLSNFLDFCAIL